ncbi:MAG: COQ9 family protein [Pseudomonadota bacterium]
MTDVERTEIERLLDAALPHVAFDGWSETTFRAAARDAEIDLETARSLCPRGSVDLALAFHEAGDAQMKVRIAETDMSALRYRDKVAQAVRLRLEVIEDKEAVRRGVTLFSLPQYAALGASATWGTVDAIWNALGDTSDDVNWYTKRATLSGVYGSTVLYWLGDESPGHADTWAFLDRRIDDVMQIEKLKAQVRDHPVLKTVFAGPNWLLSQIKAPSRTPRTDVPGVVTPAAEG